ncbi:MAG: amidohydrolase [Anaerolineae bacterium]|nr:amidohydrolase [Anaerolineae bacterium]
MRIDCQTHVFPREYAEVLARNPGQPRAVRQGDRYLVTYGDVQSFSLDPEVYSIERKLRDMDASGIDVSVISVNMPGPEALHPSVALEAARVANDYLAAVVGDHPDRLAGLACLPWQDVPAALAEMDRAVRELDLRGLMLYSRIGNDPVDARTYDALYARAAELDVPVVIHPIVPSWGAAIKDYSMIPMVGLMVEQSFATLRLILGGVLERHRRLKVVQPHCGGILPYLWGRIENQTEVMGRGRENITQPARHYYRRVYLDTVSPAPEAIRFAYDFAGADRLVFGSDHPWVDIGLFLRLIEGMDVPAADKERILGGNARQLFRIR